MDQTSLVKADRDAGAEVMDALNRMKIPVTLCEWNYLPNLEEWQLIIVTPWVESKGLKFTYGNLIDELQKSGAYKRVPMRRITFRSPDDPRVQGFQQKPKDQQEGFVHILRHGPQYSLVFAPHHRSQKSGGSVPARRFSTVDDLEHFLAQDLQVRRNPIDQALDEMRRSGAGSIYPVWMTPRQAKKLGLN